MKCEKKITSEDADGYTCYDPCGGELVYLMSGYKIPEGGISLATLLSHTVELVKCSNCGDVSVRP